MTLFTHSLSTETELRMLQPRHARELFGVVEANRAHLREWLPWLDRSREEKDSAAFIAASLRAFAETGAFVCGIWHQGALSGVIGYNQVDGTNRMATIGYWLAKSAQGQGLATSCCRALVDHAFAEYRLNRLVISVATGNRRSQAIPERLGFVREGVLREAEWLYDRFVDHTVNALLARDAGPRAASPCS